MTDLVYTEQSCTTSATVNGGNDNGAVVTSSMPSLSMANANETNMISPSVSPPSTVSANSSSIIHIPSTIAVSAAAAAAAILTNPSFSSFRQLAELWHPHVYNSAAKMPTPFSIEDILKETNRVENNNPNYLQLYGTGVHNVFNHLNIPNLPYGINEPSTSVGLLPELTNALAQHMVASSVQMQQSSGRADSLEENDRRNTSPE